MKIYLFPVTLLLSTLFFQSTFATSRCDMLDSNMEQQLKRIEIAKDRIDQQDTLVSSQIKQKQLEKVDSIEKKTAQRVENLKKIHEELASVEAPSSELAAIVTLLESSIDAYQKNTEASIRTFNTAVDTTLATKSRHLKTVTTQYEASVVQLYRNTALFCKKNTFYDDELFAQQMRVLQTRVLDADRHTKRILQSIDASYANLSLELDQSDAELTNTLKTIQKSLIENSVSEVKPLSLFRLWQML